MGTGAGHVNVAVIGAGFGGLGAAVRLRRMGVTDFVVLERGASVGGTWRDNTYPGCACDVPSHLYSFSFAPTARWPRIFSGQREILAYLERVTDVFGLRPHLRLGCPAEAMRWDADELWWVIDTPRGPLTADLVVEATGPLSEPRLPEIPGLDAFPGRVWHSARWDHDHGLRDRRVAVVGTGASAIQIVPAIEREVTALTVFQRTPPWVIPRADRRTTELERWLHRRFPATRAARRQLLWAVREGLTDAFTRHPDRLRPLEWLARHHMHKAIGAPELRRRLTPDYRIGCKRVLLSNDWYPTLVKPHVRLIDAGLREVRGRTLVAADGRRAEADMIVFATGFRVTDGSLGHRIKGRDGTTLAQKWRDGMAALRATTIAGFPNLLTISGPNSGVGTTSVILIIEAQLNYLEDYLTKLSRLRGLDPDGQRVALSPRPAAVRSWNDRLQRRLAGSVWNTGGCRSYYLDARGRNTTVWPGTTAEFRRVTRAVALAEYEILRAPAARRSGRAG
ncbi:flavin-containing monooxygenase [Streptomyces sp. 6N223]|uniref:flavin-containing monooxygenase n=1 Tax=Streptomyces sp. 6N223 TaxID=3457412 RepID=UPI003FD5146E